MPENRNNNLHGLFLFWREHSDAVSKDNNTAKEYLKEQGKNPDAFANELLKKIKKKQLEYNAANSNLLFQGLKSIKEKAVQAAKELMATPGFSLLGYMQKEEFALQNRNLENLDNDEIQNILEDYLFLKMQQENSNKEGDI